MNTLNIHLAYLCLLLIFSLTLLLAFPFSLYFFATLKALIILYFFMHIQRSENASKLYMFLALALLGIAIIGILDDVLFRGDL